MPRPARNFQFCCQSLMLGCLLVGLSQVTQAADWPGWRGPRGDGISPAQAVPLEWSATGNIAWKTPIPGVGLSSPIVSGDLVFVTTGVSSDSSRHVLCVDRATGKVRWDQPVFSAPPGKMHKFNTTASSTPVTDGERVIACFNDDAGLNVFALDFAGKTLWNKRVGTFFSNHGFAACPVIYGDGVIVNGQQDGDAFVVLLRRSNGAEIWRYTPDVKLRSFSTPVLTVHEGKEQLILTGSTQTVGLDPQTGRKIWSAEGPSEKFVSTPSVGHGLVFSFGGSPDKKAMAVRLGGTGDVSQTHVTWRNERSMPYVPSPLLLGDYLHIVNDQGIYTCLDPVSGKMLTSGRKFGPVYSSPVAASGRIYIFEDSGACTVIADGPDFEVLARNPALGESVQTTPALVDGLLIVRGEQHLFGIGQPSPSQP